MNQLLFSLLFTLFTPLWVIAQSSDSLAVTQQVDSLIRISRDLTAKRQFNQALEVNAAAEKIALERFGMESAAYGNCCFNRGSVSHRKNDYPESEKWYLESKHIREKVLGKEHPDYAASLHNLALIYKELDLFEKSEQLYLESKTIREKVLGKEHPNYATSLNDLANLYQKMGQYEKAELLLLESKAIRETMLDKEPLGFARSLNDLGSLYDKMGQYEKAEALFLETKTIREKAVGKEHPGYADCLNNLAVLYENMGKYEKAELLHLEANSILGKVVGKEHPFYSINLNNLANLYNDIGQYEKSERFYLEAKAISEKVLGKENSGYATNLNNLALLYSRMGQYDKAELLYLEAKDIREKVLGKEHPQYAAALNNLAAEYSRMGQYDKAELLYLEAKDIREKVLGKGHPFYATILDNLGVLYYKMCQFEKAKPLYFEAKSIREKALGKEHPLYAHCLNNLAKLYWKMGQLEKAEPLFQELTSANKRLMQSAARHLSEKELNNYLSTFSEEQIQILSFIQTTGRQTLSPACYDNSLFYKGFLLQSAAKLQLLALSDTSASEKFNRLKGFGRRLADLYSQPIAKRDSVLTAGLEAKSEELEKDLTRMVAGYGEARRQVTWQEVQAALKPGEAAIEFIRYRFHSPDPTDSFMYAALVIRRGDAHPLMIPLFEEHQLSRLLPKNDQDRINNFYKTVIGEVIYQLIWDPLDSLLQGISKVYASPSGLLHRINLGAIPVSTTQTFADQHHLVMFGSTRQLVINRNISNNNLSAILFGGIQYDLNGALPINPADANLRGPWHDSTGLNDLAVIQPNLPFPYDTMLRAGGSNPWQPLSATTAEVGKISGLLQIQGFKTDTHSGLTASEEVFKEIGRSEPSPRILHIATHGYFFPDPKEKIKPGFGGEDKLIFRASDHPMIRSGLILAGANEAWTTGQAPADREDGIMTAYEISQQNLSNTELVVLSACETGLGQIEGNEGVYGLQRAFKIAGAHYLIMSLWKVNDLTTSELMAEFYRQYLELKKPVPAAFREAQRAMRARYPGSPFAWAGFILVE